MRSEKRLRVLYADDNEDACLMLTVLLGISGIDVSTADTVQAAFELAQNTQFDLYLLDSRFPDGDGIELCQKLHGIDTQKPIVFYSGNAYETDKQKGLAAGAVEYLVKPNVETVAATILRLIK